MPADNGVELGEEPTVDRFFEIADTLKSAGVSAMAMAMMMRSASTARD